MDENTQLLITMNANLATATADIRSLFRMVEKQGKDMERLKGRPGKLWDYVITAAIAAVVSGVLTKLIGG